MYRQLLLRNSTPLVFTSGSLLTDLFDSLKASLVELGFDIENEPSWDTCDQEFKALQGRLESSPITELIKKPFCPEPSTVLIGTVITEAISAAYWSDALLVWPESWLLATTDGQHSFSSWSSKRSIFIRDVREHSLRVASHLAI